MMESAKVEAAQQVRPRDAHIHMRTGRQLHALVQRLRPTLPTREMLRLATASRDRLRIQRSRVFSANRVARSVALPTSLLGRSSPVHERSGRTFESLMNLACWWWRWRHTVPATVGSRPMRPSRAFNTVSGVA